MSSPLHALGFLLPLPISFELFWASNEIMHLTDMLLTIKFIANNLNDQSLLLVPHFSFLTGTDDILSKITLYGGWGLMIA